MGGRRATGMPRGSHHHHRRPPTAAAAADSCRSMPPSPTRPASPALPCPRGLWAIGCLAILTAVFGLAGGCCRWGCCLGVYLVLSVLATLAQAAFVLYLFIDPAHAEREVAKYQRTRDGTIK